MKEKSLTLYRIGYDFPGVVFPEFRKLFPFVEVTAFEATVGPLLIWALPCRLPERQWLTNHQSPRWRG